LSISISIPDHLDVTTITPSWSPRVLDEVIISCSFSSITDSQNTVVEGGRTRSREHSRLIELEPNTAGIDCDTNGLLGNSSHKGRLTSNLDSLESRYGISGSQSFLTGSINSLVGVGSLCSNSVINNILEGRFHKATVTTLILVNTTGAVDEFLFGEGG